MSRRPAGVKVGKTDFKISKLAKNCLFQKISKFKCFNVEQFVVQKNSKKNCCCVTSRCI